MSDLRHRRPWDMHDMPFADSSDPLNYPLPPEERVYDWWEIGVAALACSVLVALVAIWTFPHIGG